MAGHPDFGGTPLVHGIDIIANGFGVSMAAGQTILFPSFKITRPGYLFNVEASYPGASGNNPLCGIDFNWYDSGTNVHFGHETWRIPAGTTNNGYFHTGRGPTKGQVLQLAFINRDQTQPMESTFWLAETTQHASRDDIRLHSGGISPVFNDAPGADATYNRLLSTRNADIANGATVDWLLPLYSGQAQIQWACTGQSAAGVVTVGIRQADALATFAYDYELVAGASPFVAPGPTLVTLPRKVCFVEVVNTGTSHAAVSLVLNAMEYSS